MLGEQGFEAPGVLFEGRDIMKLQVEIYVVGRVLVGWLFLAVQLVQLPLDDVFDERLGIRIVDECLRDTVQFSVPGRLSGADSDGSGD